MSILRRHRFAAIVAVVVIVVLCVFFVANAFGLRSVDRQLDAIEAAMAIPDSENAAIAYFAFTQEYAPPPSISHPKVNPLIWSQPWTDEKYPELAAMLADHQDGIERLFDIAKIKQCCFLIPRDEQEEADLSQTVICMRQWVLLLRHGLNHDLGEGQLHKAIEKYARIVQIGSHFRRQPALFYHNVGLAFESVPSWMIKNLIVTGEVTNEQLSTLRSVMPPTVDTWSDDHKRLKKVEDLLDRKRWRQIDMLTKLKGLIERSIPQGSLSQDAFERTETIYYRQLVDRRGRYILIALRQYKNETGRWPESLDAIRGSLNDEILTDPHNGGPFLYEVTDGGFRLMSTGRNGIDEGGDYKKGDDWPIWPRQ